MRFFNFESTFKIILTHFHASAERYIVYSIYIVIIYIIYALYIQILTVQGSTRGAITCHRTLFKVFLFVSSIIAK